MYLSPRVLRGPSTDRPETLPHDQNLAVFYNPTRAPPKKLGAENMQNFGQFWTTSDFHREYLRNGRRYKLWQFLLPAFDEKSPMNFGPLTAWNYT